MLGWTSLQSFLGWAPKGPWAWRFRLVEARVGRSWAGPGITELLTTQGLYNLGSSQVQGLIEVLDFLRGGLVVACAGVPWGQGCRRPMSSGGDSGRAQETRAHCCSLSPAGTEAQSRKALDCRLCLRTPPTGPHCLIAETLPCQLRLWQLLFGYVSGQEFHIQNVCGSF